MMWVSDRGTGEQEHLQGGAQRGRALFPCLILVAKVSDDLVGVALHLKAPVGSGNAGIHPGHGDPGSSLIQLHEALLAGLRDELSHELPGDNEIAVGRNWDFHGGRVPLGRGERKRWIPEWQKCP